MMTGAMIVLAGLGTFSGYVVLKTLSYGSLGMKTIASIQKIRSQKKIQGLYGFPQQIEFIARSLHSKHVEKLGITSSTLTIEDAITLIQLHRRTVACFATAMKVQNSDQILKHVIADTFQSPQTEWHVTTIEGVTLQALVASEVGVVEILSDTEISEWIQESLAAWEAQ